jgi:CRP-like cAMP-binding protein
MARPDIAWQEGTFLGLLGEAERVLLGTTGSARAYPAGCLLTIEGAPTRDVVVLVGGVATAVCEKGPEAKLLLRIYGPGDIVGIEAVLGQQRWVETVATLSACRTLAFPASRFAELTGGPTIASAFGKAMALRAQAADRWTRTRQASCEVRLARVLLELADRVETPRRQDDVIPIDIPAEFSQETLGTWIGASRSTASRTLSALSRQGVLSTGRCKIIVTDPNHLRRIAASTAASGSGHR